MTTRVLSILSALLLFTGLTIPVATAQTRPDYVVADPGEGFEALDGATAFSGTQTVGGTNSGYRIEVPDNWNGSLVLYAHGFVGPQIPDLVVQNPPLRELFIAQGFAWAATSYSRNGYVIDAAVEETDALRANFAQLTGEEAPSQTIIHGLSMGGHITGVAVERRPDAYAGALPGCGVMADVELFDYFADVNLVAGALAGVDVDFPGTTAFLAGPAQTISANLGLQSGLATPEGVQYADVVEALSGGERPTFEESLEFWNTAAAVDLDGPDGDSPPVPFLQALYGQALTGGIEDPMGVADVYNNSTTVYGFPNATTPEPSSQEQMLNASVDRYTGDAGAPFPVINGTPQIPVLSIHTTGDLFVPLFNQITYAQEVADNGLLDNLVQRTMRAPGHCGFTGQELGQAFGDLVTWIATDEKPAGENLRDPDVVADRNLGCDWTSEQREGMPPCGDIGATTDAGPDPVATAIEVSKNGPAATTALIARSDVFADGLTGSALAGALDAPLLLNAVDQLDPRVREELTRLGVTDVILLGGEIALSTGVQQALTDAGLHVSRLAGDNRFGTAVAVAEAVTAASPQEGEAFLAYGGGFADAVAVAGLAAFLEQPILLTETDRIPVETQAALDSGMGHTLTVIGGSDVISDRIAGPWLRLAGPNRYGTSAAVVNASRDAGLRVNRPYVVDGEGFTGALVAGPAAARAGQIMVMVDADDLAGSSTSTNRTLESLAGLVEVLTFVHSGEFTGETIEALSNAASDGAAVSTLAGLVTANVEGSVEDVVAQITQRIEDGPPSLVTSVDHAANASSVGLDLPATELLIFGAPAAGTPLMQSNRTVGIDLPQKILVWSDDDGTHVAYNDPRYLAARHGLSGVDEQLNMIGMLLPQLVGIDTPTTRPSAVGIGAGLQTVDVEGTVQENVDAILNRLEDAPPMLIQNFDHSANAENADLELPPTTLLIFGAPAVGTPLMQSNRTVGIDLPQKILVWSDVNGTHVTYNTAGYLAARHGLPRQGLDGVDQQLNMIDMLVPTLATGGP